MSRPAAHLPHPPPSLDAARQAQLTALSEQALHRRRSLLAEAIDTALQRVPRPLRGALRRALGA
jgi:hypothetical protein